MAMRNAIVPKKMNMKARASSAWANHDPDENGKEHLFSRRDEKYGTFRDINLNNMDEYIDRLEAENHHQRLMYYNLFEKYRELSKRPPIEEPSEAEAAISEFYDFEDDETQSNLQEVLRLRILELDKELADSKADNKRLAMNEAELMSELKQQTKKEHKLSEENTFMESALKQIGDENNQLRQQLGKEKGEFSEKIKEQLKRFKKEREELEEEYTETKERHETLKSENKKYVKLIEKHEKSIKEFEEKSKSWDDFQRVREHMCSGARTSGPCPELSTLEKLCKYIENGLDPSEVDLTEDYLEKWRTTVLKTMNLSLTKLYCVQAKSEKSKDLFLKEYHRIAKLYETTTTTPTPVQSTATRVETQVEETRTKTKKTNTKMVSKDKDTSKRRKEVVES